MKKYEFIHPVTGISYFVECELVTKVSFTDNYFFECTIDNSVVAQFPFTYGIVKIC